MAPGDVGGSKELKGQQIQLWKAFSDTLFGNVVTDAAPLERWDSACAVIIEPHTHAHTHTHTQASVRLKLSPS